MQLNSEDGGSRRFIQVQLPEPLSDEHEATSAGHATIADISLARIRAAGAAISIASDGRLVEGAALDVGVRAYKLADTNFSKWKITSDIEPDALQQRLLDLRESSSADDATADDLLVEILLKQGYSLTEQIATTVVDGVELRAVHDADGDVAVLAYLDEHTKPTLDQLRAIVDTQPTRMIILEDAFQGDDELKTNLVQLAKSKNVELWTA
jgi:adenine-specific DNA-methyltransferase